MDATTLAELGARLRRGGTLEGQDLRAFEDDGFGGRVIGLVLDRVALDRVEAHLDADARHHQPHGLVHGGVWCAVVETLASIGGSLHAAADGGRVVGVNNSTDFLRAHRTGRVEAVAAPIHVGRSQQLWEVSISRPDDARAVARGQVRLQNLGPE